MFGLETVPTWTCWPGTWTCWRGHYISCYDITTFGCPGVPTPPVAALGTFCCNHWAILPISHSAVGTLGTHMSSFPHSQTSQLGNVNQNTNSYEDMDVNICEPSSKRLEHYGTLLLGEPLASPWQLHTGRARLLRPSLPALDAEATTSSAGWRSCEA